MLSKIYTKRSGGGQLGLTHSQWPSLEAGNVLLLIFFFGQVIINDEKHAKLPLICGSPYFQCAVASLIIFGYCRLPPVVCVVDLYVPIGSPNGKGTRCPNEAGRDTQMGTYSIERIKCAKNFSFTK